MLAWSSSPGPPKNLEAVVEIQVLRRWPAFALEDQLSIIEISPFQSVRREDTVRARSSTLWRRPD